MANPRPSDWAKRRELVIERDDRTCQNCGRGSNNKFEVHHIVPLSEGGSNKVSNLTTLCQDCHSSIHQDSKMAPNSINTSSTIGPAPSERQLGNCPECEYSACKYGGYDERTKFCRKCRTLWRCENKKWVIAPCPDCGSREGFTWGLEGRLGTCNQCGKDVNAHKEFTGEIASNQKMDDEESVFHF